MLQTICAIRPLRIPLLALVLAVLLASIWQLPASAHAQLARSTPAASSIQPGGLEQVDLWFTETVPPERASVEVYDASRNRVDNGVVQADPSDPSHLIVPLSPLPDGTYTVVWRAVSSDDGHQTTGTFSFTVGASRSPGAAATVNDTPSWPAVALRWLTLLGLAAAAGWFLLFILGADPAGLRGDLALAGAVLALVSGLLIVPAAAFYPGAGLPAQGVSETLRTMPPAWWWQVTLSAALLLATLVALRWRRPPAMLLGVLLVVAAAVTLTFTSHAAARTDARLPAMVVDALHIETVVFWIGGVAHLAVAPAVRRAPGGEATQRFSRLAVLLAPLAIVTGALSAGVTLPTLASLWTSTYGRVLLVKGVAVAAILGAAYVNRMRVWGGLVRAARLVRSLRVEVTFGCLAILLASLLAFSAPPAPKIQEPLHLRVLAGDDVYAHLRLDPPKTGRNSLQVWLSGADNQPSPQVDSVLVNLSLLERPVDLPTATPERQADGRWTLARAPLTINGWWEARVHFTGQGIEPTEATFYFLLPDPTLVGPERRQATEDPARSIYTEAIKGITELTSMRTTEGLTDGIGNSVVTDYSYVAPDKMTYTTGSGGEMIAIGDIQWLQRHGGGWNESRRVRPVSFPAIIPSYYSGATDFTLGRTEELDGELCQIITFNVPGLPGRDEAWYAWWVGTETKLVRREAMVARHHYMVTHYFDHNSPIVITPPRLAGP